MVGAHQFEHAQAPTAQMTGVAGAIPLKHDQAPDAINRRLDRVASGIGDGGQQCRQVVVAEARGP